MIQIGFLLTKFIKYSLLLVRKLLGKNTYKCPNTLEEMERVEMEEVLLMIFQFSGGSFLKKCFLVMNFYNLPNLQYYF